MADQTLAVGMSRKLAAIFSTDVAGYSRLMGDDEEATIHTLTTYRALISSLIQHHRGRVVDAPGDNLLAEFASVVDAVRCAVEIQHALKTKNAELPLHRQMQFRIGINLGDVIVEGERIYGDGVNIAARMESLAEPGGICISDIVHEQVKNKIALAYEYLGEREVKNIVDPVRVWRVVLDGETVPPIGAVLHRRPQDKQPQRVAPTTSHKRQRLLAVAGLLLLAVTIAAVRYFFLSTPNPQPLIPSTQYLTPSIQAQPALPLPDKPSIVVLPFVNMSEDSKQEYFSDGITEDLTSDLSKLSGLFVISRNSAFTYKGKAVKAQEVSKELGVRYLLEGSVRKADDQVRISAQLIDATTGSHQWAERYDRPLKDIFALQDEIVQKIVANLQVKVFEAEMERARRIPTGNLTAYDYLLRGLEYFLRTTKENNLQARQLWEKAIVLDPQYALAYTNLGFTYYLEWVWRWSQDAQTLEQALAMGQRAVALDDSLPEAHGLLGMIYALKKQYDQAMAEGERAIALDPNNANSYGLQAEALNVMGRPEEALRAVEHAIRLNPRAPEGYSINLGIAYYLMSRYTEAISTLKGLLSRNPNWLSAYPFLSASYMLQWIFQQSQDAQTLEQALAAAQRTVALNDAYPGGHALLGIIYLWQKQYEPAHAEIERMVALDSNDALSYAILAETLGHIGRPEEALQMVEQAQRRKPYIVDVHLNFIGNAYYLIGKPAEAVTPLQQYLARYPNFLGAHLTLAAVYSELGQGAEARAEVAEVLRLNPKFSLEVHQQRVPIKEPAVLDRYIAALRKAGLK